MVFELFECQVSNLLLQDVELYCGTLLLDCNCQVLYEVFVREMYQDSLHVLHNSNRLFIRQRIYAPQIKLFACRRLLDLVDLEVVSLKNPFSLKLAIKKGYIFVGNVNHVNTRALELLKQKLVAHD